jgi:hypothetical protein
MKRIVNKSRIDTFLFLLFITFYTAGCNAPRDALKQFDASFRTGALNSSGFDKAVSIAQSKTSNSKNPKKEDLLWSMQLGGVERMNKNFSQSNEYFDKSEEMLNYFDYQNETVDSAMAIVTSDNIIPYVGEEYDGIMVNTYKALNFMALGDNELARVEFNRALDRQRRATENFEKEIAKLKKELDKEQAKEDSYVNENVDNPEVQQLIKDRYPGLYEFKAYPDFVNPFTNYIAGIFFALIGDSSKAAPLLKESYGMVSENNYIAEDLALVEQILDGKKELKDMVWVVFENGMGPVKVEEKFDVPILVERRRGRDSNFRYFGIALPKLSFRQEAYPILTVKADGNTYETSEVANMDRVIQTEFQKDFKGILTRAIISATSKVVAQYALEKNSQSSGQALSFLAAVYTAATTAADVRIWTTLPKNFQVARLNIPENRCITISPPGGESFQIEIPACKNSLVYVKIPFRRAKPVYDIMTY